jgi:hypothetical protein
MEVVRSSETSVLTRDAQRNIPEEGILHSHRRENLKFYQNNVSCAALWNTAMKLEDS